MNIEKLYIALNNLRVIPRLMVFGYSLFMYEVSGWFMNLPNPSNAQSNFIIVMVGASAAIFGLYTNSGGNK